MTEQLEKTERTTREKYAAAIRPAMLLGLQDAELHDGPGTERINDWIDWIAETLAEVRDLERDLLEQSVQNWRTAAGASMTLADQLRGQLEAVRRTMAATDLIPATVPDSDASLAELLQQGLDAFWARMTKVDEKADKQMEELTDLLRQFKAWGEQQQTRAEKAERAANLLADSHRRVEKAEAANPEMRGHLLYVLDWDGPGHCHLVAGRWDKDGSPCDHCARLAEARAALEAER